ncbi:MAG: response regulator transcription factor [Elusimicrobiota bacterium]
MAPEKRILIADDDRTFVSFVQEALSGRGLSMDTAFDGESALSKALSGGFDLILLDVMMPKLDGYHISSELVRSLGERAPKILIVTARDTRMEKGIAFMAGAVAVLQKPFLARELRAKVAELLGLAIP